MTDMTITPPIPSLVIRPSGVWNTRAPLHLLLFQTSLIQRDYSLLTLAVSRTRYDAAHFIEEDSTSPGRFIRPRGSGPVSYKAWRNYRDWWRKDRSNPNGQPSLTDFDHDLGLSLYTIREASLVKIAAHFELFTQCWALNMLLAILETGGSWSPAHEILARELSPVHTPNRFPPGVPAILKAFPVEREELRQLPHIKTDPMSGADVNQPVTANLNALSVVLFWRDFRNLVVHRGGLISREFADEHGAVFEALRQPYKDRLRSLEPSTRLQLPDVIFYAMISTHHRTAKWLNGRLQQISESRRGIIYLPEMELEEPVVFDPSLKPLPLLMDGDHSDSLRWIRDTNFREQIILQFPKAAAKYLKGM